MGLFSFLFHDRRRGRDCDYEDEYEEDWEKTSLLRSVPSPDPSEEVSDATMLIPRLRKRAIPSADPQSTEESSPLSEERMDDLMDAISVAVQRKTAEADAPMADPSPVLSDISSAVNDQIAETLSESEQETAVLSASHSSNPPSQESLSTDTTESDDAELPDDTPSDTPEEPANETIRNSVIPNEPIEEDHNENSAKAERSEERTEEPGPTELAHCDTPEAATETVCAEEPPTETTEDELSEPEQPASEQCTEPEEPSAPTHLASPELPAVETTTPLNDEVINPTNDPSSTEETSADTSDALTIGELLTAERLAPNDSVAEVFSSVTAASHQEQVDVEPLWGDNWVSSDVPISSSSDELFRLTWKLKGTSKKRRLRAIADCVKGQPVYVICDSNGSNCTVITEDGEEIGRLTEQDSMIYHTIVAGHPHNMYIKKIRSSQFEKTKVKILVIVHREQPSLL